MQFDINEFVQRLLGRVASRQEATQTIYEEIRAAENQKEGFLDQATENPEFYNLLSSQVDKYVTSLKVLHNQITPQVEQKLDEQIYLSDKDLVDRTMMLIKQIDDLEKK